MEVLLLRKPYEASLSGNPVAFIFVITPYSDTEHSEDVGLNVTVQVEEGFNTDVFTDARQAMYLPNASGVIEIDVQQILQAYLTQYVPSLNLNGTVICPGHSRRYRLRYQLIVNGAIETAVATTENFFVIKGGLPFQEWHPKKFFTEHLVNNKPFLRYSNNQEKVHADEKKYLSWVYPYDDHAAHKVMGTVFYHDGSQASKEVTQYIFCEKWQVCITPAGFNQIGLDTLSGPTLIPLFFEIKVVTTANVLIASPQRFVLDYRNFYNTYNLLFSGSLGSIETLRLRGQVEAQAEYQKTVVDRILPSSYFPGGILQSPSRTSYASENEKFTGDTGFIEKEKLDRLRDVFLSQDSLFEIRNNRLIPVVIDGKTVKLYTNSDKLFSLSIEWRNAFINQYYAPENLLTAVNASCPLPVAFQVRQVSRNFIQVLWSLEPEYSEVEIEYPGGETDHDIIRISGNTGQAKIAFKNPLIANPTGSNALIIRARTVCNSDVQPASVSAWLDYSLTLVRNYPPIAIEDNLTAARGILSPVLLAGNLLDNDYDPDGDPIRCLAVNNQPTVADGRISITADGRVTYLPPSGIFEGEDSFLYEIREVNDATAFARALVKIVVGSPTAGSVIYARLVIRNVVTKPTFVFSSAANVTTGEVWVDFFADAIGTLPIDVSALSLTVNYQVKTTFIDNNNAVDTNNFSTAATGNKTMLYQGKLAIAKLYGTNYFSYKDEYSLLAGTGYEII